MADFTIRQFVVGEVMTNCYFAINEKTKEMFIVDPGGQPEFLSAEIEKLGVTPTAILLTHGHFDHVSAAEPLKRKYDLPVYIHEAEKETLADPVVNLSIVMMQEPRSYQADHFVRDNDELMIAGCQVRVLFLPGHTAGGVGYYLPQENSVFSGDSLFCESVGRTDFPGGNASTLIRSIREKLFSLPDSTKVYPGHEELTTIGYERVHNPFL